MQDIQTGVEVNWIIGILVLIFVIPVLLYFAGLFLSAGWHKAKRNHIRGVVLDLETAEKKDNCHGSE